MATKTIQIEMNLKGNQSSQLKEEFNTNDQSRDSSGQHDHKDDYGNRMGGHLFWFFLIALCTAAVPVINLTPFIAQTIDIPPGKILQLTNKTVDVYDTYDNGTEYVIYTYFDVTVSLNESDISVIPNYNLYYGLMAAYVIVIILFSIYSSMFTTFKERVKLYLLIDNMLICEIATAIAFLALQIQTFSIRISSNPNYPDTQPDILTTSIDIGWQDIVIMILYLITNFVMIGSFRVFVIHVRWSTWKVVVYKLAIILTSILYIALGVICLYGQDGLSHFTTKIYQYVENEKSAAIKNPEVDEWLYIVYSFDLDNIYQTINDYTSTAKNILLLYVFTNFGFSFEIVAKLSDFDGTSDLEAKYELEEEDEDHK